MQPMAQQFIAVGLPVVAPVTGMALIDTGASTTCIDDAAAQSLGLPIVDVATMSSASHASSQANIYPISIEILGLPIIINVPSAMGAALAPQGLLLLIGRDFLRRCTLFYNGVTGEFTIAI
jgi:predicted aspartyl protease